MTVKPDGATHHKPKFFHRTERVSMGSIHLKMESHLTLEIVG